MPRPQLSMLFHLVTTLLSPFLFYERQRCVLADEHFFVNKKCFQAMLPHYFSYNQNVISKLLLLALLSHPQFLPPSEVVSAIIFIQNLKSVWEAVRCSPSVLPS